MKLLIKKGMYRKFLLLQQNTLKVLKIKWRMKQDYDEYFDNLTWKDALDNWLTLGKSLLQE